MIVFRLLGTFGTWFLDTFVGNGLLTSRRKSDIRREMQLQGRSISFLPVEFHSAFDRLFV